MTASRDVHVASEPEDRPGSVRVWRDGPLGRLLLDRPERINALTLDMIVRMRAALLRWEADPAVERVLVEGAGERGLCAGGDIRVVHDSALAGDDAADRLWREEFLLDALIADCRIPVVVVLDGIAMGGGLGLGGHAAQRVVTERSVLAMPEVRIGISPDVGGTLLFARAPGRVGTHLAMTGDRFGPADALYMGIADRLVPSEQLGELAARLVDQDPAAAIDALAVDGPSAPLAAAREWIDHCYDAADAVQVVERLRAAGRGDVADRIEAVSPTAVCVARRAVERAGELDDLADVLAQDLRVARRLLTSSDPVEGIRAVVVDRTHEPRWSPARLADVDPDAVEAHFAPLGAAELDVRARMRDAVTF